MSKFFDLKNNKGKKRNVEKPIEVVEPKLLEATEVETLLQSLNEPLPEVKVEPVKVVVPEVVVPKVAHEEGNFIAYGIAFNNERKKFMRISLDYNPKTGYSKIVSVEDWADDPMSALRKLMQILSLKLLKREEQY